MRSLMTAATGMHAQQLNVEVISNNIANLDTTGFKRQRAEFVDLLYQDEKRVGTQSADNGDVVPSGVQIGVGVKAAGVYRMMEQGALEPTDNPFDMAINGRGFFQITLPSGDTGYTRAGSFQLSPDGTLVTNDGFVVQPNITIPQEAITVTINQSGEVLVTLDGQVDPANVGQINLSTFANEAGLNAIGDNLFLETTASGAPASGTPGTPGLGTIQQGFLETSNVNIVSEITNMITAQRAYEMNSQVIETSDQMMGRLTQLR